MKSNYINCMQLHYTGQTVVSNPELPQPLLATLFEQMKGVNTEQWNHLNSIEAKLYNFHRLPQPEIAPSTKEQEPVDFIQYLQKEIDMMRINRNKIEGILSHLNQII